MTFVQLLVLAFASIVGIVGLTRLAGAGAQATGLSVDFYDSQCPRAEAIIRETVAEAFHKDPNVAAGLLRLFFHDCWVIGCDASVLIVATAEIPQGEQENFANKNSLRGMEVIDAAKAKLEAECPGTVSCADILAFASQIGVVLTGGPVWQVEAGRRDGRVYNVTFVNQLPFPTWEVANLTESFAAKGFSVDEMITLSGAHSIGQARCTSIAQRFNASSPDRTINDDFRMQLSELCPSPDGTRVDMESTPLTFDNQYYWDLVGNRGMFKSDQTLYDTNSTRQTVLENAMDQSLFFAKFVQAMVKLGRLNVVTGFQEGEIRLNCSRLN